MSNTVHCERNMNIGTITQKEANTQTGVNVFVPEIDRHESRYEKGEREIEIVEVPGNGWI